MIHEKIQGKDVPRRGNTKFKGSGRGENLTWVSRKEASG